MCGKVAFLKANNVWYSGLYVDKHKVHRTYKVYHRTNFRSDHAVIHILLVPSCRLTNQRTRRGTMKTAANVAPCDTAPATGSLIPGLTQRPDPVTVLRQPIARDFNDERRASFEAAACTRCALVFVDAFVPKLPPVAAFGTCPALCEVSGHLLATAHAPARAQSPFGPACPRKPPPARPTACSPRARRPVTGAHQDHDGRGKI